MQQKLHHLIYNVGAHSVRQRVWFPTLPQGRPRVAARHSVPVSFPHIGPGALTGPSVMFLYRLGDFAAAASFVLSDQKETKESPGADSPCQGEMSRSDRGGRDRGFWERPAADALVFREPLSPGPPFYGDVEVAPRHLRPAREVS